MSQRDDNRMGTIASYIAMRSKTSAQRLLVALAICLASKLLTISKPDELIMLAFASGLAVFPLVDVLRGK